MTPRSPETQFAINTILTATPETDCNDFKIDRDDLTLQIDKDDKGIELWASCQEVTIEIRLRRNQIRLLLDNNEEGEKPAKVIHGTDTKPQRNIEQYQRLLDYLKELEIKEASHARKLVANLLRILQKIGYLPEWIIEPIQQLLGEIDEGKIEKILILEALLLRMKLIIEIETGKTSNRKTQKLMSKTGLQLAKTIDSHQVMRENLEILFALFYQEAN